MQFRNTTIAACSLALAFAAFYMGYQFGKNDRIKESIINSLPFHIQMYERIRAGETNAAAKLAVMGLMGEMLEVDGVKSNHSFAWTTGRRFIESESRRKQLAIASAIIEAERTNFVTIFPDRKPFPSRVIPSAGR